MSQVISFDIAGAWCKECLHDYPSGTNSTSTEPLGLGKELRPSSPSTELDPMQLFFIKEVVGKPTMNRIKGNGIFPLLFLPLLFLYLLLAASLSYLLSSPHHRPHYFLLLVLTLIFKVADSAIIVAATASQQYQNSSACFIPLSPVPLHMQTLLLRFL